MIVLSAKFLFSEKIKGENMKAIIIDDEQKSHLVLTNLLTKNHVDIEIVGHAYNVEEGVNLIYQIQPELVFLDVEMPDGTGLELLQQVDNTNFYVIFTTGYNKYAHAAIRFGALDYLLKPVVKEELKEAIDRARVKKDEKIAQLQIQILTESLAKLQQKQVPSRLAISTKDGIIYKKVNEIIRLEAKQNYTEFSFVRTEKKILTSINLGEYERQFINNHEFMRIHRSHLINLDYVDRYIRSDGGYVRMKDSSKVIISRIYKNKLLEKLEKL